MRHESVSRPCSSAFVHGEFLPNSSFSNKAKEDVIGAGFVHCRSSKIQALLKDFQGHILENSRTSKTSS